MWSARKSRGFNHKQSNGKDKSWKTGNKMRINENLLMSVKGNDDCRQVAVIDNLNMGGIMRNSKSYVSKMHSHKRNARLSLYKPNRPNRMSGNDSAPINLSCGYRITILNAQRYSREFVLNSLRNLIAPDTFVPIMYQTTDESAIFYVDDKRISEKLQNCDKQIRGNDGFWLRINISYGFPRYELDQTLKDRMTEAIMKKYVTNKSALDMSRFHLNPDLVENYYCSLTRMPILAKALQIVTNLLPDLVEIRFDDNQLYNLKTLKMLTKLPNLKILGLCDNKIAEMDELDAISELKLEELRLAGNPICQKYNDRRDQFISDVMDKFPDIIRLDGIVLRASIGFDLADDRILRQPAQRLFSPNGKVQEIASIFLQEYFRIFDSENRQPLLDAYDENASFSMTFCRNSDDDRPSSYLSYNRNLYKIEPHDEPRGRKLRRLKQGRLPIVACIAELPKTQHDLNSFTMDIALIMERMMLVTVTGMFKEIDCKQKIRYFSRTFIITPKGEGYCIVNEMLQISKPTDQQIRAFQSSSSIGTTSTPIDEMTPENLRVKMTVALRERTRMNLEWTVKCLNEVNWDFDRALAAFTDCQNRGAIPSDAFEK